MPFRVNVFQENVAGHVGDTTAEALVQTCETYGTLTTPGQKARCIKSMMDILDRELDEASRQAIMQACGRRCIGAAVIDRARRIAQQASDLDDLLVQLNEVHLGGGHLRREGDTIHAAYDRCYCGSVSKAREPFSATYCHCSCGWYGQLFEALLERPVRVELLGSILQGDDACRFLIHVLEQD